MTLKKFSRQRNIRIFNIFREENTCGCFFCFTCIFTRIRMIQSKLALVHCGLHPTYLSKVGSAVPISTIIFHHHFCQSWRASVNEVQKVVLVDNYISPHRIRCCANFSLYLTLTLSYCFLFPSFTFLFIFFLFLFPFVIDIIKAQLLPSMSKSAWGRGSIVSYIIHHITICIMSFYISLRRVSITFLIIDNRRPGTRHV